MKKTDCLTYILFSFLFFLAGTTGTAVAVEPVMITYTYPPPFLSSTVNPAVVVILDTSTSMLKFAYANGYNPGSTYDGYFDAAAEYSYNSTHNYFYTPKDPSDTSKGSNYWEGKFLNWACMRRMDIAKNVLTGGRTYTAGDGELCLLGQPYPNGCGWPGGFQQDKSYDYDGSGGAETYHHYQDYSDTPYFRINSTGTKYYVRVKITQTPEGIIQQNGPFVNFGLAIYGSDSNGGSSGADQGGEILNPVGDTTAAIIANINSQDMLSTNPVGGDTWTQMAETLYTVVGYLGQDSTLNINAGPKYHAGDYNTTIDAEDPYYSPTGDVWCVDAFVILISDGEANRDTSLPASLKTSIGITGTDKYLDDVAHWAHTNDIRSGSFGQTLDGTQTVTLYTVSTFGGGAALLESAAKYGGFVDSNGDSLPDLASEWDEDGDGTADNYFSASNSAELTSALNKAIVSIMQSIGAGSAVSILSTSSAGEGILMQAYFRPKVAVSGSDDVSWAGYVQALWMDEYGNMREDTVSDRQLDIESDRILRFIIDGAGDTKVETFAVSADDPYPDVSTATPAATLDPDQITPIWEAGKVLSDMASPAGASLVNRKIFTFIDKDNDGSVDETTYNAFDNSGEVIKFDTTSASVINPYLGVKNNSAGNWDYLASGITTTDHDNRVDNIVNFIRGHNTGFSGTTDIRSRRVGGTSGSEIIWPLGDTVNASPVVISSPPDNFGLIYSDYSYQTYYNLYKDRETVVYIGANDGMLHAFTSWEYDSALKQFTKPTGAPETSIGTEIWAYIPQAVLPHLKWLPSKDYTHVYYVDQKVRIVDAKIFTPDADHPNGWGTILIAGLNLGGKDINVTDDFDYNPGTVDAARTFKSSYFAIDITKPRVPKLLWERNYDDLGLTTSRPTIIRVQDEWFAVFGSGPTEYDGTSTNTGHIYIVDLLTGSPHSGTGSDWFYNTGTANAFMGSPAAVDMGLNYNVDAVYMGETNCPGTGDCSASGSDTWGGSMYKIDIPWIEVVSGSEYGDTTDGYYVDDPADGANPWSAFSLFTADGPVTAAPALSIDGLDNLWVYFGTGRYWNDYDKINIDTQYFYGIKDPFFNAKYDGTLYHQYLSTAVTNATVLNTDNYAVLSNGSVIECSGGSWTHFKWFDNGMAADFLHYVQGYDGWERTLQTEGERSLTKPAILGGIVLPTTFVPNDDVCGYGGDSYLYGLYYETGTAFTKAVFNSSTGSINYTDHAGDSQTDTPITDKISLGTGISSSVGLHVGKESGATGLIQMGSGSIHTESITPALTFQSGLKSWIQR